MLIKSIQVFTVIGFFLNSHTNGMEMDELRDRFVRPQAGGRVMQRDIRLSATIEVLESNASPREQKPLKWTWFVSGSLPHDYASQLTQPILTALPFCPETVRTYLNDGFQRKIVFTFDIGGTIYGPVIGWSGHNVYDQSGVEGRGIT